MKKILIIGNRKHQFIINYVKWYRKSSKDDCIIDVLSYEIDKCSYNTDSLYDNIYILRTPRFFQNIRLLSIIYRHIMLLWNFRILVKYDVVHVHYIEDYLTRFSRLFSTLVKNKLIVSVWGSDYLKAPANKIKRMSPLFRRADIISIVSDDVIKDFNSTYSFIPGLSQKIIKLGFGLEPLESLLSLPTSKTDRDNITITIGYNARINQQHLAIINAIESDTKLSFVNNRIKFVIPLTYPCDIEYITKISESISNSKFSYSLLTDYMNDEEVARLRNKTDVFIQLQETDMMSGSMLEHLAAGSIVITGSWLPYTNLEDLGLIYWKVDKVNQVADTLYRLISDIDLYKSSIVNNRGIVFSNFRWENVIKTWIQITEN